MRVTNMYNTHMYVQIHWEMAKNNAKYLHIKYSDMRR